MTDLINFQNNGTQLIDFSKVNDGYSQSQKEREYELQARAGKELSNNFRGVREQAAARLQDREEENLYQSAEKSLMFGVDANRVSDIVSNYRSIYNPDTSLEKEAAEQQTIESYNNNKETAINSAIDGDDIAEDMTKLEIFTSTLGNLKEYSNSFSKWKNFSSTVEGLFAPQFFRNLSIKSVFPKDFTEDSGMTSEGIAQALQKVFGENMDRMSADEYKQFCNGVVDFVISNNKDPLVVREAVELLEEGANPWIDRLMFAEIAGAGIHTVNKMARAASAVGDLHKIDKAVEEVIKNQDKGELVKEFLTPSAVKPVSSTMMSNDAHISTQLQMLTGDKQAFATVDALANRGIKDPTELDIINKTVQLNAKKVYGEHADRIIDIDVFEDVDGATKSNVLFGSKNGKGMNSITASNLAKRLGLAEDQYKLVKKNGSGYFVQVTQDADVKKVWASEDVDNAIKDWSYTGKLEGVINHIIRNYAGVIKTADKAHAKDLIADRIQHAIQVGFKKDYKGAYNKLNKADKHLINRIYKEGNKDRGKWFTLDELKDFGANDNVIEAYKKFKTISDIEYLATNDAVRRELMRRGYKSYNGLLGVKENYKKVATDDTAIVKDIEGNLVDLKAIKEDEGIIVRLHKRAVNEEGLECSHVFLKTKDIQEEALPQFVTKYAPGGRRQYTKGNMFVRIGASYWNPTTGTKLNGYSRVLMAGTDVKALKAYANEVNIMRGIAKEAEGMGENAALYIGDQLARANFQHFKVDTYEEFAKLIKSKENPKGIIDPDFEAIVCGDGEKYMYNNGLKTMTDDFNTSDEAMQELLDMRETMYYTRGNTLDDVNGGEARIVDIDRIFDRTINKAAHSLAKSDLIHWYGSEFRRKFASVLDNTHVLDMSDYDMLNKAILRPKTTMSAKERQLHRAAENFLRHSRRIMNAKTDWDKRLERVMQTTAEAFDVVLPSSMKRGAIYENIATMDPAKFLRSVDFNFVMGQFNPAQFFKQGLGVASVVGAHPVKGNQAILMYPFIRLARGAKENSKWYGRYKDIIKRIGGLSDEDFDGLMKYMDRYGTDISAGRLVGTDSEYKDALTRDGTLLQKAWDSQYLFMNEGNALNYYVADIAAWLTKRNEGIEAVIQHSDDLFLNMTRASQSAFQTGQVLPTTSFAQWLSYPSRMVEAMFNKRLTVAQRAGIASAQFAMWGFGGTLLSESMEMNMYQGLSNRISPEAADILTSGVFKHVAKEHGILFDESLGLGEMIKNFGGLYKVSEGKLEMPDIPISRDIPKLMAAWQVFKKLIGDVATGDVDFYRYMKEVSQTANLSNAPRNLSKAVTAWRYGKFYDNRGRELNKEQATELQVMAQALGFGPYNADLNRQMYVAMLEPEEVLKEKLEEAKEIVDRINHYVLDEPGGEEYLQKLWKEYEIRVLGTINELQEMYPETDLAKRYTRGINNFFTNPETRQNVTQETEERAREVLGNASVDRILQQIGEK